MVATRLKCEGARVYCFRLDAHMAAKPARPWRADFIDVDFQRPSIPSHRAGADLERGDVPPQTGASALGHRPSGPAWTIERDVHRAMIEGITMSAPSVIGRKHTAYKGDDRQPKLLVFAESVDIPPSVAAGRNVLIKARSAVACNAACQPESAAIGTPGPGCTLPPAR